MLLNELIFLMALESVPAVLTEVVWLSWSFYRLKKTPLQLFPWVRLSNELQKGKRKDIHWPPIMHEAHYMHPFVLSSQDEQCYSTLQMGKPRLKEGQLDDSQACTLHLCSRRAATGPPPRDKSLQSDEMQNRWTCRAIQPVPLSKNIHSLAGWEAASLQMNGRKLRDPPKFTPYPRSPFSACWSHGAGLFALHCPLFKPSHTSSLCNCFHGVSSTWAHVFIYFSKWDHVSSALNWRQVPSVSLSSLLALKIRCNHRNTESQHSNSSYHVPGIFMSLYNNLWNPHVTMWDPIIIILILQMRTERHREVK